METKRYKLKSRWLAPLSRFSLLFLLALAPACASAIEAEAMVPESYEPIKKHTTTLAVLAKGGKETTDLMRSKFNDDALREAIETAIRKSGLFAAVAAEEVADYLLTFTLLHASDPPVGSFNSTSTVVARWTLDHRASSKRVFETSIEKSFTAHDFIGTTRFRNAVAGAARENIKEGIARLAKATF